MIPAHIDKSQIPHKPGVYLYKDIKGEILYVGKAINLYHRIASYFSGGLHTAKTAALLQKIAQVDTIEVSSEIEALILEANLIKKYRPPFNTKLTDDKDFLYIKITNEEYPRILTARKNELVDAGEYFGPFPSSKIVRETLKKIRRLFPWCNNPYSKKPCFYYHLHLCSGPCAGVIDQKGYKSIIKMFSKFMQGKKEEVLRDLTKEMEGASKSMEYERAAFIKKVIDGIEYLTGVNNIEAYLENPNFLEDQNKESLVQLQKDLNLKHPPQRIECYDISNLGGKKAVGSLVVLSDGEIDKKWYRKFKIINSGKPNDVGMIREVVSRRLKHKEWPLPDLILVDGGKGQVGGVLEELRKKSVFVPVFGIAKKMEWLYQYKGEVIKLSRSSLSLRLLQKIRDEAHRFAIAYHRRLMAFVI